MSGSRFLPSVILLVFVLSVGPTTSIAAIPNSQLNAITPPNPVGTTAHVPSNSDRRAPIAPGVVLAGPKSNVNVDFHLAGASASDASPEAAFTRLGVQAIEPVLRSSQVARHTSANPPDSDSITMPEFVPNEIVVKLKPQITLSRAADGTRGYQRRFN